MLERIKNIWKDLDPAQKRKLLLVSSVLVVIIASFLGYYVSRGGKQEARKEETKKELTIDTGILSKSLYQESQKEIQKRDEEMKQLKAQIEELQKSLKEERERKEKEEKKVPPLPSRQEFSVPPPPPPAPSHLPSQAGQPQQAQVQNIGGIMLVSRKEDIKLKDDKKKLKGRVYLPPSFMEATLLSGLDAPTVEKAKGNPVPVILRVKTPAVLPNEVKADLKGCFVIAEGYGDLADERVHLRLVSLSCLAKNGEAVIDQKVKGFVVDRDGKVGLKGRVVSKMGSILARAFLAGFFEGLGEAVRTSAVTTSVSALGATQTIEPGDLGKAAVGSGIAQSARELQKFYLELARQTIPVVEVGAAKQITVVISEGVELEIKDYCMGGKGCEEAH